MLNSECRIQNYFTEIIFATKNRQIRSADFLFVIVEQI